MDAGKGGDARGVGRALHGGRGPAKGSGHCPAQRRPREAQRGDRQHHGCPNRHRTGRSPALTSLSGPGRQGSFLLRPRRPGHSKPPAGSCWGSGSGACAGPAGASGRSPGGGRRERPAQRWSGAGEGQARGGQRAGTRLRGPGCAPGRHILLLGRAEHRGPSAEVGGCRQEAAAFCSAVSGGVLVTGEQQTHPAEAGGGVRGAPSCRDRPGAGAARRKGLQPQGGTRFPPDCGAGGGSQGPERRPERNLGRQGPARRNQQEAGLPGLPGEPGASPPGRSPPSLPQPRDGHRRDTRGAAARGGAGACGEGQGQGGRRAPEAGKMSPGDSRVWPWQPGATGQGPAGAGAGAARPPSGSARLLLPAGAGVAAGAGGAGGGWGGRSQLRPPRRGGSRSGVGCGDATSQAAARGGSGGRTRSRGARGLFDGRAARDDDRGAGEAGRPAPGGGAWRAEEPREGGPREGWARPAPTCCRRGRGWRGARLAAGRRLTCRPTRRAEDGTGGASPGARPPASDSNTDGCCVRPISARSGRTPERQRPIGGRAVQPRPQHAAGVLPGRGAGAWKPALVGHGKRAGLLADWRWLWALRRPGTAGAERLGPEGRSRASVSPAVKRD